MAEKKKRRRERRDLWLLRGVALVITLLLWILVLGGKRVELTKRVALDFIVPNNLVIANQPPREIFVRVAGPRAFLKDIEERVLTLPIELVGAKAGDFEVFIREEMLDLPLGLRIASKSQDSIQLKLDRVGLKRVPIRANVSGILPAGFRVANVTTKPSTVEVRGPAARLANLESIPTEPITLSGTSLKQEFEVKLNFNELTGVSEEGQGGALVRVAFEIEGALARKWFRKIPVGMRLHSSSQAEGQIIDPMHATAKVRPETVSLLLEGPEKMLEEMRPQTIQVWAELPSLKAGNYRARLDWKLAPEVKVVRRSTDWIDVSLSPR